MFVFSIIFAFAAVAADSATATTYAPPQGATADALTRLSSVLAEGNDSTTEMAARAEEMAAACSRALQLLQPHSPVADELSSALKKAQKLAPEPKFDLLAQSIKEVVARLEFKPLAEAKLPQGFPTYTPVGTIEVKHYPAYRMATSSGFWPLFLHIQSKGIAMTAPVEVQYKPGMRAIWKRKGWHFSTAIQRPVKWGGAAM